MSRPSKGSRLRLLGLDQDLIERMQDFREACLDAKEGTIIAEALRTFIANQVKNNRDIGRRFRAARKRRGKPL
jgi:hypothetical protein